MPQLELRIPPPLVLAGCAALAALAAWWLPLAALTFAGSTLVAGLLGLVGALVALAGVWQFRRARTTVNPLAPQRATAVVSTGLYAYTRNPMYLGMALVLLGWAVVLSVLSAYLVVPLFVAYITRYQIRPEERALQELFGREYTQYMARVRRWL